MIVFKKDQNY